AGRSHLGPDKLVALARATFPVDQALAARAAALAGTTLEMLGLVRPRAAAPPPPAPVNPTSPDVADSVLCAAAEAMNLPPQQLRPTLHAAFARARTLGLTVEMVADAFERRPPKVAKS
ncbi:MAG TPA: hypothetical protein VLX28_04930, partial [Thermoanaerobaculia bacterium]|nr:hypothetical protein [Thermoanaerobaculia bacterium]